MTEEKKTKTSNKTNDITPQTSSLLEKVSTPQDLKSLKLDQLSTFSHELRHDVIKSVALTGGHLGASLGVIELTVALHYVFDAPNDRLIWDVGHQAYPHKILTGRREQMFSLRKKDGLSGFTKRKESEYDPFGAGHSSTSISAGLGMSVASNLQNQERFVVSVIGDGAMSAGMAYEALNHAGGLQSKLLVVLNDNDMSIDPPAGALREYLLKLTSSPAYKNFRDKAKGVVRNLPSPIEKAAKRLDEFSRGNGHNHNWFEDLGFYYLGPVDGHQVEQLTKILQNIKESDFDRPILLHVKTEKGKGYKPAEESGDKYHGVTPFVVATGEMQKPAKTKPSYTNIFAEQLIDQAKSDEKIVGITAAMPSGTGLIKFAKEFPERCFDVGIAEQHAVTFAAGLASEGMRPYVAIYSTFLQRAYDQIVHDVVLQKLPVRFAIDRAGYVGADGATHSGSFDISYLGCLPDIVLMAAGDEVDLKRMVKTSQLLDDRPCAFRYPRGEAVGLEMPELIEPLEIGKGRILVEGQEFGRKVAILSYGGRLQECLKAAELAKQHGLSLTVADARFAKPLDTDLISQLSKHHEMLITIEEGSVGGFGSYVMRELSEQGLFDQGYVMRSMTLPDIFLDQAKPDEQYDMVGLTAEHIVNKILSLTSSDQKPFSVAS